MLDARPQTSRSSREYPSRPIVGVAGLVLDAHRVLLIRRGRPPLQNAWSLPGGALRVGERITDGVIREVFEETALHVIPIRQVATLDRILPDETGRVQFHYVLIDWLCRPVSDHEVPAPGSDALEVAWIERADLHSLPGLDQIAIDLIERTMDAEAHTPTSEAVRP